MQDWSTEDFTRSYGDTLYVAPQDNDAGIYLDEGYDDLGRRRPDPLRSRAPAGEYLAGANYVAPAHATHWSRAQSDHYPGALNRPGCSKEGTRSRAGSVSAYGPQRIAPPCESADPLYDRQWGETYGQIHDLSYNRRYERAQQIGGEAIPGDDRQGRKEGFDTGFHLTDRGEIRPIYSVNWDERPMGYNPNAGPEWARLVPGQARPAVPSNCAAAYPGVPTQVNGMSAQSWAQNVPWASGPPTWPGYGGYYAGGGRPTKERFGASPYGDSSGTAMGGPIGGSITLDQIQLVFLFIILVMLSLILRAVERRQVNAAEFTQNQVVPVRAV